MHNFFYKNFWLFYLLFFLLLGLLIYSLLWDPSRKLRMAHVALANCEELASRQALRPKALAVPEMKIDSSVFCDAAMTSGGQGRTLTKHLLGGQSGRVLVQYDMQHIPDEIKVIYDGQVVVASNSFVSGVGLLEWQYQAGANRPDFCMVEVSAPSNNTVWEYLLNCPK